MSAFIEEVFGEEAATAFCIAAQESRFDLAAVSPDGQYYGSLQVDRAWRAKMTSQGLDFDVEADRIVFAKWLYEQDGWTHWPVAGRMCAG